MTEHKSWRVPPFVVGQTYKIRLDFTALRDSFCADETLRYTGDAYSVYDSCTGYLFLDSSGQVRVWDIYDDDDVEIWQKYFLEANISEV